MTEASGALVTRAWGSFDWLDGERSIHFGRGRVAEAVELAGGSGYTLLTTERAAAAAAHVVDAAGAVVHVPGGRVDDVAAEVFDAASGERLVALGGGRVIDVAKAVAAARRAGLRPGADAAAGADTAARGGTDAAGIEDARVRVAAIPTTLSGAEMTQGHRQARGVPPSTPRVRPAIVINDPALCASQPVPALAASALNAFGHAVEGPCTTRANPVGTMAAIEGARLLCGAFDQDEPARDELALGALLAAYAIDAAGFGLHHVLAQTIVRVGGIPHGVANAILLPHTIGALAWRFPAQHARLAEALGAEPADVAARICALTGTTALRELGVTHEVLTRSADAAARRDDLEQTPPRASRAEILTLYEHAC